MPSAVPSRLTPGAAACLLALAAAAAVPLPSLAQVAAAAPASPSPSPARDYDLPAGPLGATLNRIAREAGLALTTDAALVAGRGASAVRGRFDAPQALRHALAGTGLALVRTEAGGYTLRAAPSAPAAAAPAGAQLLPEVRVTATADPAAAQAGRVRSGSSAGQGYVVRRSAGATKTDAALLETPQSISVIARDNLDERATSSVSEALLYSANVNGQRYGADTRSDYFTIRGFNADLYLDGLRIPQIANQTGGYAGFLVEPYTLDRIEVIRGSSSALFGASGVGGIVNLVSKEPQAERAGEVYVRAGSFGRKETGFDLTGPLNADGTLSWRVNGLWRDADTSYRLGRNDRVSINPSIAWRPDARTSLVVSAGYTQDKLGQAGVIIPARGSVLANSLGSTIPRDFSDGDTGNAIYDKEMAHLGYRFEHAFSEAFTLRHRLRYSRLKTDYRNLFTAGLNADQHTLTRTNYTAQPELDAVAVDTQAEMRFATGAARHVLLAGVDLQWQKLVNLTGSGTGPTLDLFAPDNAQGVASAAATTRLHQRQAQTGLYLQDMVSIDRLRIQAGIRKDFVRIASTSTALASGVDTRYEQDPGRFTGKIGVSYLLDSGLAPYALYSTSFLPTLTLTTTPLKPTTGELKEIGIKYAPAQQDYSVTLSAFETTQQNVTNRISGVYYQTDAVRVRGLELEGVASLGRRLNLTASASLQDPEVTRSQTAAQVGKLPYTVPRTQVSVFSSYRVPLAQLPGQLVLGGGARYIGKTAGDSANSFFVPAYTLLDAFLRYDIDRYSLQLNAYNLGNKSYVAGCNSTIQCYYGQGRTVVATASVRW